jgi:hypothetical protein
MRTVQIVAGTTTRLRHGTARPGRLHQHEVAADGQVEPGHDGEGAGHDGEGAAHDGKGPGHDGEGAGYDWEGAA